MQVHMIVASVLKATGGWSHFPCDDVGQRAQEEDLHACLVRHQQNQWLKVGKHLEFSGTF